MDLVAYVRVLRRFWWIVIPGFVLAVLLTVLSVARVTSHGLTYRSHEVWQSESVMFLTQPGFPWGRATLPPNVDLGQLDNLTGLYSQFASSDAVRRIMRREGAPKTWKFTAVEPPAATSSDAGLPLVGLAGTAYTPNQAVRAVLAGRKALLEYVSSQDESANIPAGQRVVIQVLQNTTKPTIIQPRKKTLPIVVFIAVLTLTVGLAFVLENARPRVSPVTLAGSRVAAPPQTLPGARQSR